MQTLHERLDETLNASRGQLVNALANVLSGRRVMVVRGLTFFFAIAIGALGLALLGVCAVAAGAHYLDVVPSSISSLGLVLSVGMLVLAVFFLVGMVRRSLVMMTVGTTLLAVLVAILFGMSLVAYADESYIEKTSGLFHAAWRRADPERRLEIEHKFSCCGFDSPTDYYGQEWNATCSPSWTFEQCCGSMRVPADAVHPANSAEPFRCAGARFVCCYLKTDFPCATLPSCSKAVTEWATSKLGLIGGFALALSVVLASGFGLFVASTRYISLEHDLTNASLEFHADERQVDTGLCIAPVGEDNIDFEPTK